MPKTTSIVSLRNRKNCEAFGKTVAEHWIDRKPLPMLDPDLPMTNALIVRNTFLKHLESVVGRPAGYKVAAITPPAQRDLGICEPLGAIYLLGMFSSADSAKVSVTFGARPIVEAKMMAVVGDKAINDADSPQNAAKSISHLVPSLELGDSLAHRDQRIIGAILTVYNVGARCVLTGPMIPFSIAVNDDVSGLEKMIVSTHDVGPTSKELERHSASVMMGSPLNAIYWIVQHHRAQGFIFKQGDRLGLGALSRVRPTSGQTINTVWEGLLTKPIEVGVTFA